jgi:hypothetical protein
VDLWPYSEPSRGGRRAHVAEVDVCSEPLDGLHTVGWRPQGSCGDATICRAEAAVVGLASEGDRGRNYLCLHERTEIDMRRQCLLALSGVAVVGAALSGPGVVGAAPPQSERIVVDEESEDRVLSEECGVPVTTRVQGHVIARTFDEGGTRVVELNTINLGMTATAGDRTFRFRDVGADLQRIEPDGTAVLQIIGQVPAEFAGVLRIDIDAGEAILEPRDRSEWHFERACTALTG